MREVLAGFWASPGGLAAEKQQNHLSSGTEGRFTHGSGHLSPQLGGGRNHGYADPSVAAPTFWAGCPNGGNHSPSFGGRSQRDPLVG